MNEYFLSLDTILLDEWENAVVGSKVAWSAYERRAEKYRANEIDDLRLMIDDENNS